MPGITHKSKTIGIRLQNYVIDDLEKLAGELNLSKTKLINMAACFSFSVHQAEFLEFIKRNDVLNNTHNYRYR